MKYQAVSFKLDGMDWVGGVSDKFSETPLGSLASPLTIEQIADVEWTIVDETFVSIFLIEPSTQLKFWMHLPEKARKKIIHFSETIVPFLRGRLHDRYLISYTVETLTDKYIGFLFESMLSESKAGLYVFMQAKVEDFDYEAPKYLKEYLEKINNLNPEEPKSGKKSGFEKILALLRLNKNMNV